MILFPNHLDNNEAIIGEFLIIENHLNQAAFSHSNFEKVHQKHIA